MIPGIYNYGNHYKGDTLEAVAFTITYVDSGLPIDLTNTTVIAQFRKPFKGAIVEQLTLGNGLTMDTPTLGRIIIDDFNPTWEAGGYLYDIEFTFTDTSIIKTYVKGTITVVADN